MRLCSINSAGETQAVIEQAETGMALAIGRRISVLGGAGTDALHGWALTAQGQQARGSPRCSKASPPGEPRGPGCCGAIGALLAGEWTRGEARSWIRDTGRDVASRR